MLSNTAVPKYYGEFRDKVLRGEIRVCETISLEMNRIDSLIKNPTIYYDPTIVEGWIKYAEAEMVLTDGSPLKLLDSFKLWAEQQYCWYYFVEHKVYIPGENGSPGKYIKKFKKKRLIKKQIIIVARSNSKTLYASCDCGYNFLLEPKSSEFFTTGPTIRQAQEILTPIKTALARTRGPLMKFYTNGNIKATRGTLANRPMVTVAKDLLVNNLTNSTIETRPMSIDKFQGFRPKRTYVDEWLSGETRENVISAIEQGASKNDDDYLILMTSSEGTVRNGVGDDIKMEVMSILKGEYINPHVSIFYYKQDSIEEISDPSTWVKSNPNIGVTVSYEAIQLELDRAEKSPSARNDILAKRFNIALEGTTYFFTWAEIQLHPKRTYKGIPVSIGMDASLGDDFWSFSFLSPKKHGFIHKTLNFISQRSYDNLPPALKDQYSLFIKEGSLIVLDGTVLDDDQIYDLVDDYITRNEFDVICFGYDRYNANKFMTRWERENGSHGIVVVRQGYQTESVPLGEIKAYMTDREIEFDQEITKFAMGNSIILTDNNGNRKLYKARREKKIDVVSSMMDGYVAYKNYSDYF